MIGVFVFVRRDKRGYVKRCRMRIASDTCRLSVQNNISLDIFRSNCGTIITKTHGMQKSRVRDAKDSKIRRRSLVLIELQFALWKRRLVLASHSSSIDRRRKGNASCSLMRLHAIRKGSETSLSPISSARLY